MAADPQVLVVGAGPAGMAAAIRCRGLGLSVVVADDQPAPGGQIWRGIEARRAAGDHAILGSEYAAGAELAHVFRGCGCDYRPATEIWHVDPDLRVYARAGGRAVVLRPQAIILANGAQERPMPFAGWTLPGVVTVGAAQILLKTARQVPADPVWIAGSGPLPLLYAVQLLEAGGSLAGFLDTTPGGGWWRALPHVPAALAAWRDLMKGLGWMARVRREASTFARVAGIAALGNERLESVRYEDRRGRTLERPANALLVHEGVVPSIHMALALGAECTWREDQMCFAPVLDEWGETTRPGVFVAGDGAAIGGAAAAQLSGELAAIGVARKLAAISPNASVEIAAPVRRSLKRALALRPFLDAMFRPRTGIFAPDDDTIVCRCEEVTVREIREAALVGRPGPNQVKAFTRAGMGPCQGRQCAYTLSHIIAAAQGRSLSDVGYARVRSPLRPVTLGEIAALADELEASP